MPLSRRSLLSTLPAATLPATALPLRARAAGPPATAGGTAAAGAVRAAHTRLIDNTVALFAGTRNSNARPEVRAKLASIAATARSRLTAMDRAGPGELFRGIALGTSDPNLATSFQYLYEIALATRTPAGGAPSGLEGDTGVQRRVIDGLTWLHEHYYGDQSTGYYGNWFTWEIGISTHVSRILALLAGELAAYRPGLAATYVASMDAYLRNGRDGDVDLDSRFHTGANLADITTNRILQGAVLGDDARITKALADQLTVLATIDPYHLRHGVTDGFYADGSFIQHASVAYTGSYGKGLLTRLVQTIEMLDGTGHTRDDRMVRVAQGWVRDGFAPLIFEGWLMEIVKGRGVSRTATGYADAAEVVEAVVGLSAHATGADATALKGYVAHLRRTSTATLDPSGFVSPVSIARYADILADPSVPAGDLGPAERHVAFNAMDRTVHRRPGYAFALARSSSRISRYEYMNGENLMPWFQGDGAHHLYLSGQDQAQAFGVDHLTVVPPHRLAGITAPEETRRTVPQLYGTLWYDNPERGFTSSSEAQNTYVYFPRGTHPFSGGAALGAYGVAGLVQSDDVAYAAKRAGDLPEDFVAYRNAEATKSWFLFDDEIVVLAAGVGDRAGRAVTTTVDTRIAAPSDTLALTGRLRDGAPWSGTGTAPLAWLRYANATRAASVGYVFLDGPRPTVTLDTVTRSRRAVRLANPDTPVTKQLFAVTVERAAGAPPTSMAYALVPNATERRLRGYAHRQQLTVLTNTTRVQAVIHRGLRITALNAFTPGVHRAGPLSVRGPGSVILRETRDGAVAIAVSDPTTERGTVPVVIRGRAMRAVAADDGVRVTRVPGGTRITVTTRHAYGRSFTATLR
ncbi:polysaccharide lyase family 8 super-sandwich domain-containing protein [Streptomyces hygroscopicus]|uniref:polysaccharide lyase family 8 super-sandwich domain-containing protein n=1 Tax=Streptomyces hygroscopicus TaxID=1912 RepID=UPI001F2DF03F|nr:polysaccharide lyase family 8 super-sandwich domain-containing protein [Streptomyces hygroscopicus]